MNLAHIRSLDLNLLVLLAAVYRHKNVSKAARELGVTQSAVSHALTRLRDHFGDPLFVRVSRGVLPTELARKIEPELMKVIQLAEQLITRNREFDPKLAKGRVALATTDLIEILLMPALFSEIQREAPNLQLSIRPTLGELPKRELENGSVDLAIAGFYTNIPEGFYQTKLFTDSFLVGAAKANRSFGSQLSEDDYFRAKHALITLSGDFDDDVRRRIRNKTQGREVVYGTYSFTSLAWVLQESDLLLTAPSLLIESYRKYFPMKVWKAPVDLGSIQIRMIWHDQTHQDDLRIWIRQKIRAHFATPKES